MFPYAFPLTVILSKVLQKLGESVEMKVILIAKLGTSKVGTHRYLS